MTENNQLQNKSHSIRAAVVKDQEKHDFLRKDLVELTAQVKFYQEVSALQDMHMTNLVKKYSTTLFNFLDESNACKTSLEAVRQELLQRNFGLDAENTINSQIDFLQCDRRECLQAREAFWLMKIDDWRSGQGSELKTEGNLATGIRENDFETSQISRKNHIREGKAAQSISANSLIDPPTENFDFLYEDAIEEAIFDSKAPVKVTFSGGNAQGGNQDIPWYQQWKKRRARNGS